MILLTERAAILIMAAFLLTRIRAVRRVLNERATWRDKLIMVFIFSSFSIFATHIGIPYDGAIASSRAMGPVVAGLLAGPWVGVATGFISGIHRYALGGYTGLAAGIATMAHGFIAGWVFRAYRKQHREVNWVVALWVGFFTEWVQMGILLLVAYPYTKVLELVEVISIPMSVVNSVGVAVFIIIVDLVKSEEDQIGALQAQRTLRIADKTVTFLRDGLTRESAEKVAHEILRSIRCAAVAITDINEVLSHVGIGSSHHIPGKQIATEATREVIETKEIKIAASKEEIGCQVRNCALRSAILVPLKRRGEVVGVLKLYQDHTRKLSPVDLELVRGLGELISTQLEVAELKRQSRLLADAEIRALYAQINPHFLFNAINTIVSFIRIRPEKARELLIYLSDYFRRNLHQSGGYVSLSEELEHVEAYLAIERARFGDKLHVAYDIQPGVEHVLVPGLIIQPLVENAIKHGLLPKREGGTVTISAREIDSHTLVLTVSDDGVGMDCDPFAVKPEGTPSGKRRFSGIGLTNVRGRIQSIYGAPYDLTIHSEKGAGTTCTITLPIGVNNHAQRLHRG
ncbi:sensor histidine kinase [Brevibacillus dissolubilis]|uniref:sensor histidine kinase n=1 Tax=Brevibacillus dissolubilis TaxID=1844116 RepID=UPI0021005B60|nr:sensor histidine kinase [Brevibacillus dissolubilis]